MADDQSGGLGAFFKTLRDIVWDTGFNDIGLGGVPILGQFSFLTVLLLGVGFYLTIRLRFMPIWGIPRGFKMLWKGRKGDAEDGEVSPFAALATALSSTVGTGNIAGVATAMAIGGPGAIFWMWMTALVGMATKYSESLLAVRYREVDAVTGAYKGGPMYYIKNGLGPKWKWLAVLFSLGAVASALTAGNMAQSNSIADVMNSEFNAPHWATGAVLAILAFVIIIGGIKSIGKVASKLVPFMGVTYVLFALVVLMMNAGGIPNAFGEIFGHAFGMHAAIGGFTGAVIAQAISNGVSRGLFSNEAGQGSAPIAHAAAQTKDPKQQATIAMLGTFIDTIVICTMTALVILTVSGKSFSYNPAVKQMKFCNMADVSSFSGTQITLGKLTPEAFAAMGAEEQAKVVADRAAIVSGLESCETAITSVSDAPAFDTQAYAGITDYLTLSADYAWQSDDESASITSSAFDAGIPGGGLFIAIALLVFAFTTILGWSYYGERALSFLFGERAVLPFRIVWCGIVFVGAITPVATVWHVADVGNGLMAAPNLIAVLLLSGVVVSISRGGKDTRKVHEHDESAHAKGLHDVEPGGLTD